METLQKLQRSGDPDLLTPMSEGEREQFKKGVAVLLKKLRAGKARRPAPEEEN